MKGQINLLPNVGDKVECLYMDKESDVLPGTIGEVVRVQEDPFVDDAVMIYVNWESGSSLPLLSDADKWRVLKKENLEEQANEHPEHEFFANNTEIFEFFDYRFLFNYLKKIQESGITNMFGSSPLLYAGEEHIDRYFGEGQEDNEAFQEVLEMAEESKRKMIQGTMKYLESKDMDLEMDKFNSQIKRMARQVLGMYVNFYNVFT